MILLKVISLRNLEMNKTIFLLLIFIGVSILVLAQSSIRLNNYWVNTHFINPAATNEDYLVEASAVARQQWIRFYGAPSTFFLSTTFYDEKSHAQFGLNLFQDKIGYTSKYDINLSYSYSIILKSYWQLHLGLAIAYQGLSYDISAVNLSSQNDQFVYQNLLAENDFNSDIGAELTNKNFRFGISGQHLISLFSGKNNQFPNTNFLYAMYRIRNDNLVNFGWGICGIQTEKLVQMEMNMTSYFKSPKLNELFYLGVFYRTQFEIGAFLGLNITNLISASYSYDYDLYGISRNSFGTHELMLTYKWNKKKECQCNDYENR